MKHAVSSDLCDKLKAGVRSKGQMIHPVSLLRDTHTHAHARRFINLQLSDLRE